MGNTALLLVHLSERGIPLSVAHREAPMMESGFFERGIAAYGVEAILANEGLAAYAKMLKALRHNRVVYISIDQGTKRAQDGLVAGFLDGDMAIPLSRPPTAPKVRGARPAGGDMCRAAVALRNPQAIPQSGQGTLRDRRSRADAENHRGTDQGQPAAVELASPPLASSSALGTRAMILRALPIRPGFANVAGHGGNDGETLARLACRGGREARNIMNLCRMQRSAEGRERSAAKRIWWPEVELNFCPQRVDPPAKAHGSIFRHSPVLAPLCTALKRDAAASTTLFSESASMRVNSSTHLQHTHPVMARQPPFRSRGPSSHTCNRRLCHHEEPATHRCRLRRWPRAPRHSRDLCGRYAQRATVLLCPASITAIALGWIARAFNRVLSASDAEPPSH